MNAVEDLLLDLLQVAETPLYSAYRWVDSRMAERLPMVSFLRLVQGLIADNVVRLWEGDPKGRDRTEWFEVPSGLEARYVALTDLAASYDPFHFSLTLGEAAPAPESAAPGWTFDLDAQGNFELQAPEEIAESVLADVSAILHLCLRQLTKQHVAGTDVAIRGKAAPGVGYPYRRADRAVD